VGEMCLNRQKKSYLQPSLDLLDVFAVCSKLERQQLSSYICCILTTLCIFHSNLIVTFAMFHPVHPHQRASSVISYPRGPHLPCSFYANYTLYYVNSRHIINVKDFSVRFTSLRWNLHGSNSLLSYFRFWHVL
jgi:hypothetical protein